MSLQRIQTFYESIEKKLFLCASGFTYLKPEAMSHFCNTHFIQILQDLLYVLLLSVIKALHTHGFNIQLLFLNNLKRSVGHSIPKILDVRLWLSATRISYTEKTKPKASHQQYYKTMSIKTIAFFKCAFTDHPLNYRGHSMDQLEILWFFFSKIHQIYILTSQWQKPHTWRL